MSEKFTVICADPPYIFSDKLKMDAVKRGAEDNYPVLTIDEIKKLPINKIADEDGCLLALWVPSSLLEDGLEILKKWGFNHKQTYIWVKTKKEPFEKPLKNIIKLFKSKDIKSFVSDAKDLLKNNDTLNFGMGRLFRQTHEICLIGTNNNKIYKKLKNKSQKSVCLYQNNKHSEKPSALYNSLDIMFPNTKKIELFARKKRDNWICIGNEVCDGEDVVASLERLINVSNIDNLE